MRSHEFCPDLNMRNKKNLLLSKARNFPESSGVYLFYGNKKEVLYIGRAVNLRKRILSYFQKNFEPRISEMVALAEDIQHKKTETILEAIILEANLIKKHWPKYNIRERDSRSFVYIVIPRGNYPQPFIVRGRELEKIPSQEKVFGPYKSIALVKKILKVTRRVFPFSMKNCKPFSNKPCFDYQIGLCPGLCLGLIIRDDYQKNIKNFTLLLSGRKRKLLERLKKENPEQIKGLEHIQDVALISQEEPRPPLSFYRIEGYDVSHLYGRERMGAMVVFAGGEPEPDSYRLFKIRNAPIHDDLRALKEVVLRRFNHPEWTFPDLIFVDGGRPQISFLTKVLKGLKKNIPLVGISKYREDEIVFPSKMKPSLKELIITIKPLLLRVREESHRFAIRASRRQRRIKT